MRLIRLRIFIFAASIFLITGCEILKLNVKAVSPLTSTLAAVQLSWTASSGGASGYVIEQSTDNVLFTQIQTLNLPSTTTTVVGLTRGRTYYFRIRAYNSVGNSDYSTVVSVPVAAR
jgi:predicted phage tail protein